LAFRESLFYKEAMENNKHRPLLQRLARQAMIDRGLWWDFSPEAQKELKALEKNYNQVRRPPKDMRQEKWCSIDNDESRDLDQLTLAQELPGGRVKIFVAIADVDFLVKKDSAIDQHARNNTTSIYTSAQIFPMLPEKLSTDLTSLNLLVDRPAMVIEMSLSPEGTVAEGKVYPAMVQNKAKLAYNSVGEWLENRCPIPSAIFKVKGLEENIRLQDAWAQKLRQFRYAHGALELQTIQSRAVFQDDDVTELRVDTHNRAKELIEDFMVAANGVVARFLKKQGYPSLRRVVRTPKRWDRIVEIAAQKNYNLPRIAESQALEAFLESERQKDPLRFPDLSLSVVKLLGKGEYIVEFPDEKPLGHFGLAMRDYTHSTAPNRRFPDLITQRLLKFALNQDQIPYGPEALIGLANNCTKKEDDANKVERQVQKSAAALLLSSKIGQSFEGLCTGAADKGTWIRLFNPPVEGRLVEGFQGVDVGQRLRVQLLSTNVERGFIDFKKV
jgi:VacB/RNase II family 3'-5' exoribonuclease